MKLIKDLGPRPVSGRNRRYGLYECPICKNNFETMVQSVNSGGTKKCKPCSDKIKGIKSRTHNLSCSRVYRIWKHIKQRCFNVKSKSYINYGGRGITVCNEWKNSFEAFNDWALSNGYSDGLSIDRINNDGNYEPSNCRFANDTIQARNTRILSKNNTSGFRGVVISRSKKRWRAQITINYALINIGSFDTKLEAAKAYDNYVMENNLEHTINGI